MRQRIIDFRQTQAMPPKRLVAGNHRFSERGLQFTDDTERPQIGAGNKYGRLCLLMVGS